MRGPSLREITEARKHRGGMARLASKWGITNSRLYKVVWYRTGRCRDCGGTPILARCLRCLKLRAARDRRANGYQPWEPGSRGHKPLTQEVS